MLDKTEGSRSGCYLRATGYCLGRYSLEAIFQQASLVAKPKCKLIDVNWKGKKMSFVATREDGHSLTMDAPPSSGGDGEGFTPVELILAGLGGCTGIDIVTIMQRQRQQITSVEVKVTGTKRKELPHYFEAIDVHYLVRGRNISESALKRAIELSEQTYCSVRAIFRPEVKLAYSYEIAQETTVDKS